MSQYVQEFGLAKYFLTSVCSVQLGKLIPAVLGTEPAGKQALYKDYCCRQEIHVPNPSRHSNGHWECVALAAVIHNCLTKPSET